MTDVLEILQKLPKTVFIGPTEAKTLAIETGYAINRGVAGYSPIYGMSDTTAERLNKAAAVTVQQKEAMIAGSMFGWDVPGADPDTYKAIAVPK